jgi:hypothetical protein
MFPIMTLLFIIVYILIHISITKKPRTIENVLEIILLDYIIIIVGIGQTIGGLVHIFNGPAIARAIGWAPGSPFQYEVGMANIAIGIAALLGSRFRGTYWLAVSLISGIFFLGAGVGHVRDFIVNGNSAAYNIGPMLYLSDGILPIALIILTVIYVRKKKL